MSPKTTQNKPVYYVIMLLIPAIILLLIEGILRIVGFGKDIPLFVPSEINSAFVQPNPNIVHRYFHQPELAPNVAPDTFLFSREKPATTKRIILMGGSSAAGFPYGRFGAPSGLLQHQLKSLYPEQNIEVISVAMASVNSYALRDFVEEVIALNPDAVLIYAGHNEYLGIMGVGSVYAGAGGHYANLIYLKTRHFRLVQLLQSLLIARPKIDANLDGRTVMATVAKERNIALDSDLFNAGLEQFESNLGAVLSSLSQHGIPVFIGNLVSNEKHQPPFESEPISPDPERSARYYFARGTELLAANQHDEAQQAFSQARDLDLLRFRAPSHFNPIIARLSDEHQATLVDFDQLFRSDSTDGIIGNEHMLEHLHPTSRGYFLMAYGFLTALQQQGVLAHQDLDKEQLWQQVPLNDVDHYYADYKIAQLTADYPFNKTPQGFALSPPENQAQAFAQARFNGTDWLSQQQELLTLFQRLQRPDLAADVAALLADALATNHQAANVAAQLYRQTNQLSLAQYYARQATDLAPQEIIYRLHRAQVYYLLSQRDRAKEQLRTVLSQDPDNQQAQRYLKLVNQE
ncbi:hypothetical protein QTP81_08845 [Alteromonas sp. ASW11-36]|uniref:SGNH hydrolase-type esterase domain-containing protein n=1 Tax=Alteromonas arenosi TaxID=3055817 RepID=A0ABT7SYT0_9ALTE|nr:hypothetical protein [Alteromonas sp. ASW11-36]MDM7860702.1 hypothetical protein [Alteromonas sp. ASW11-36]